MTLNRLGRRERMAMVEHVTGGKALPAALLEQIVERTDGVPLFVEELTKAVLESEQLDQPAQQLAIPTTLQASLMSRVDRLGSAREVLQIGAAIGREFSYELLAAVAGLPDQVLQDALARLTEAELVFPRGTPPNATYSFKHALVQDAAYSTHAARPPPAVARRHRAGSGEALPRHGARNAGAAVRGRRPHRTGDPLLAAGRRSRPAPLRLKESIAHYSNALRLRRGDAGDAGSATELELDIRLGLGLVQLIAIGPTAKEPVEQYQRALALSQGLPGRGRERFLATWGSLVQCDHQWPRR